MHAQTFWTSGDFRRVLARVCPCDRRHENGGSASAAVALRDRIADRRKPGRRRSCRLDHGANVPVAIRVAGSIDNGDAVDADVRLLTISNDDLEALTDNQVGAHGFAKCGPCTPNAVSPFLPARRIRRKTALETRWLSIYRLRRGATSNGHRANSMRSY